MKICERVLSVCDGENTNIVKNDLVKEGILKKNEGGSGINSRKRLHEEQPMRVVLGDRSNKIFKLKEEQNNFLGLPEPPNYIQQEEIRNSVKRKRISSTSANSNHKKVKLDLDEDDTSEIDEKPIMMKTLKTTKDLYGCLFPNTAKPDLDEVFKEDRFHRLLEKEKDLPTSPVIEYLSPMKETELKIRRQCQCGIINIIMDRFHYRSETGLLAMAIFDDCWRQRIVNQDNSKKIAITSVYIAAKYEEVRPLCIDDLNRYVSPVFSKDDIVRTEVTILNAIDFNVVRPLSIEICRCFAFGLTYPEKGNFILDYICFVVAADYRTAHIRPSTIASCAIIIASEIFNIALGNKCLSLIKKITKDDFSKILPEICKVVIDTLSAFTNSETNRKSNEINSTFDKKKYDKSTRYFYTKLPQLIGFYEDIIGKSE
uniref:CYCLIN domain-containing protein n=1 Tax=Strongyloides papillosus TaxID=174720 RepID=A0A0N5BZQ2_STREA